jgi:hypothetical protein
LTAAELLHIKLAIDTRLIQYARPCGLQCELASIEKPNGGLELPPNWRQERLGHASNMMTSDICGHLFSSADDGRELAQAKLPLISSGRECSNGATWPAMSRYIQVISIG